MCCRASLLYPPRLKPPVTSRLMQEGIKYEECNVQRHAGALQQRAASAAPLDEAVVVCVLIHVGVAQARTRLQPAILVLK
jgi:hypothetical protein